VRLDGALGAEERGRDRRNAAGTPGGPVYVGHDFTIDGSPDIPFVFDGLCNLTAGHDVRITNRTVNLGLGFGGHCEANGQHPNDVGHHLVITGVSAVPGFFGASSIRERDDRGRRQHGRP
jgi:hypothetical protein